MMWPTLACLSLLLLPSSATTMHSCPTVKTHTNIEMHTYPDAEYTVEQSEYWSTACSALKPSCIVYPKTAREVAEMVHIINDIENNDHFAVKSGGHNPNNYFASIKDGPLISTKKLDQVKLDDKTGQVRVGPGNRWDDVAEKLNGSGWTVVGGRIGNVGVGGYMLGGGLSFLSQQYGWAVSSIIEMEVVLPNGTIVTTSRSKHPDLFKVLRGGGNAFGIVTSYLLQGYKQGQVWGGTLIFQHSNETDAKLLAAMRDFTQHNKDNKAAIILTAQRTAKSLGSLDMWTLFVFYDGPTPPAGTFDSFTDAHPTLNTAKTQSYSDLLNANNAFVAKGSIFTIGTETVPLPMKAFGKKVLGDMHEYWRNVSAPIVDTVANAIVVQGYQPFPKRMARISRERGRDLIDMDDSIDRIIIELNYAYTSKSDAKKVDKAMKKNYKGIRSQVLKDQDNGMLPRGYLPLFMNDAYHAQDYFSRLRPENRELARKVAEKVDPKGLFRDYTGGFKPRKAMKTM
ncbi:FAD binding domain-containing protein [Thelonectria olida]|uniref:FAD binding domain-containing protein n=1 Tax=Thelonectria olida TaxID=1576542 RepID=A0A9P8W2Z9_9HYPO|nr:FAD binding domain-containing protein [Thelonectria olida]